MSVVAGINFDRTLNIGHVLQALTIAIGLSASVIYGVQRDTETRLIVASVASDVKEVLPRTTALEAANVINTERLSNHAQTLRSQREDFTTVTNELRKVDTQIQTEVNVNRVDIATIKGSYDRKSSQ